MSDLSKLPQPGPQCVPQGVTDVYLSLLQFIRRPPLTVNFLVRPQAGVASATLRRDLHRQMMAIDPELPDYDMATLD
jgi:hypothetical protein